MQNQISPGQRTRQNFVRVKHRQKSFRFGEDKTNLTLAMVYRRFYPCLRQRLYSLCEAFTFCVFWRRPLPGTRWLPWPAIEFRRPSTIMMKWRPVMLAPLISVTLVARTSTAVRLPAWPLASEWLAVTRWPWCESSSEYIWLVRCRFSVSILYIYI